MKVQTNVEITRTKSRLNAEVTLQEFIRGDWLKLVPNNKLIEVNYDGRRGALTIVSLKGQDVVDKMKGDRK
jgi:hypothetical protein